MKDFFKDLVVVELASVLAGPAVGMFFSEMGAKVIKIENKKTGGDITRQWKTVHEINNKSTISSYYHSVNYKKESLILDLSETEDKTQAIDLIRKADIVISNFRTGSDKKIGMDYNSLKKIKPDLIYASLQAYAQQDPRPGFDALMQAETGWMSLNGHKNGDPVKMPVALIDILSAHQLKEGILIALLKKEKTGMGSLVTASLFESGVTALANQASSYLNNIVIPKKRGSQHPSIAPYGDIHYEKNKKPILLAVGNNKQFIALCHCLKISELANDKRFNNNASRVENRDALNQHLKNAFRELELNQLMKLFSENDVPASPINNLEDLFKIKQAQDLILNEEKEGMVSQRVSTIAFNIT